MIRKIDVRYRYEPDQPPGKSYVLVPKAMLSEPDQLRSWVVRCTSALPSKRTPPEDQDRDMARINFVELPARDLGAARAFYSTVFGWDLTDFGPSYSCTMTGTVDLGLQGDMEEASASPLPVMLVDDLEAAQVAVGHAGGTVTKPIFGFPGGRRFHFLDPNGLELAVMQAG